MPVHNEPRREAADLLRSRRTRLRPADLDLPTLGRRRTSGLRREEVALLAGVSTEYYTRLEQGKDLHPSDAVIDAIATALRLDTGETRRLRTLLRAQPAPRRVIAERVRPGIRRLLETLGDVPTLVLGRTLDVLAWNSLGGALLFDFAALPPHGRNLARLMFTDSGARLLYADWQRHARECVGFLRDVAAADPHDPALARLVGDLSIASGEFAQWWARPAARRRGHGPLVLRHPQVGELRLGYETLSVSEVDTQTLVTFTAAPDGDACRGLALLATLAGVGERATPIPTPRAPSDHGVR